MHKITACHEDNGIKLVFSFSKMYRSFEGFEKKSSPNVLFSLFLFYLFHKCKGNASTTIMKLCFTVSILVNVTSIFPWHCIDYVADNVLL